MGKFDNKNFVIYLGIFCTAFAVLYFYRFHFATVAFSYVLGCLACYYGLNSNILQEYISKLKCHFAGESCKDVEEANSVKGCETCGSKDCERHDSSVSTEPWVGFQIHKQLDQAIEDFYNTILEQFINSWYSKVTLQPFFVDELRHQLRYASASLLRRAIKINYSELITGRLVPCAMRHYWRCSRHEVGPEHTGALHPAVANRSAELDYLRAITNAIMPYLLKSSDLQNPVFTVLIREIFAGWVLLSLTDVLADPYILNTLIILATGDETMAQLPTTPNYKVEFLETFVRQTESIYTQRTKLFRLELDLVISEQDYFYAFMQFMKSTSHLHLLQFYNDIKSFQTKLLDPELSVDAQSALEQEARALYSQYTSFHTLAADLQALLRDSTTIKQLQTSRELYQAARQSHALLEKVMLPRFLHSEEFYKLLLGSRIPTGYQKQMVKKPHERLLNSALKIGNRLKGALRSQTVDGQVLDCFTNSEDAEGDGEDNMDILKYLESLAAEESLKGQDLSSYKVVLTNVETKLQVPPRRGTVRVFTITVHRIEPGATASLWTVERSEHDFHLLRSKLHEFHGDRLLLDLQLPSRRDNSPLETLRYKYEDFLQRSLQKSLLQTSELLRIFLTEDGDFSLVVQASTLNANSTDLTNIYQSVTHKLRKEKGQHLESFLRNLLVSSDIERYQALKQGTTREVEEAQEVNEESTEEHVMRRQRRSRNIHATVFGNNFDVQPALLKSYGEQQSCVVGFTQCLMYLLIKVLQVRGLIVAIVGTILGMSKSLVDDAFNRILNSTLCRLLSERRLAHLIRLGHGLLFNKKSSPRPEPETVRSQARRQLLSRIPPVVTTIAGTGLSNALCTAFDIIQNPQLNKQLVYNLLDLCVMELFPELANVDNSPTRLPKS